MLELKPKPASPRGRTASESTQSRKLLFALILLLVGFIAILVNDRQFWFGGPQSELEPDEPAVARQQAKPVPNAPAPVTATPVAKKKTASAPAIQPKATEAPAVSTNRTVLPPLDIEVVAGDKHRTIRPGNNATKLQITDAAPAQRAANPPATTATERERLSAEITKPTYPALAQHMNVQGSVVLQALISAEGVVENLRVLNGPAILASAAEQAVREWRFKPVLQDGQPVETKATITVNFSIKVGGNPEATTLAESRSDGLLIFTR